MNSEEKENMPKGWEVKRLEELCFTTSGGTPSRKVSAYYKGGTIPWIKSGELDKGVITKSQEYITEDAVKKSSAKIFPKGTLLIALYGATIGKLGFLGIDAATNQAICGIFKSKAIDLSFLGYYLSHNKSKLIEKGIGGAQPNISQTILKNFPVPIPPPAEQHRIVEKIEELFSALDKGREYLEKVLAQCALYRQSVLKSAFEGKLTNTNVKDGELPEGWECKSLGQLKEFSLYGPRFSSDRYSNEGVAVLRTTDISDKGKIDWINAPKINLTEDEIQKYKLEKNDLLITRTGSIGTVSIFDDEREAIAGAFLIYYRLKTNVSAQYIFYFLKSHVAQDHFKNYSTGVGRPNINVPSIELLQIPTPPNKGIQEQIVQEIEKRLSVNDHIEQSVRESLAQTEALRQSILKKAFEGTLVPQNPDDEPAAILLERIKAEREAELAQKEKKTIKKSSPKAKKIKVSQQETLGL